MLAISRVFWELLLLEGKRTRIDMSKSPPLAPVESS
jgi:hypothetical protein